jgi:hypothetical protein
VSLLIALLLSVQAKDTASLFQQITLNEYALATAINNRDPKAFNDLSDSKLHISWSYTLATKHYSASYQREEWAKRMERLPVRSYRIHIEKIELPADPSPSPNGSKLVSVSLIETWELVAADGRKLHKRIRTVDAWQKKEAGWKLAARICQPAKPLDQ